MHHLSLLDPRPTMWFPLAPTFTTGGAYTDNRLKLSFRKLQEKQQRKGGHAAREIRQIKCSP
jgi:hypothetical protein